MSYELNIVYILLTSLTFWGSLTVKADRLLSLMVCPITLRSNTNMCGIVMLVNSENNLRKREKWNKVGAPAIRGEPVKKYCRWHVHYNINFSRSPFLHRIFSILAFLTYLLIYLVIYLIQQVL